MLIGKLYGLKNVTQKKKFGLEVRGTGLLPGWVILTFLTHDNTINPHTKINEGNTDTLIHHLELELHQTVISIITYQ